MRSAHCALPSDRQPKLQPAIATFSAGEFRQQPALSDNTGNDSWWLLLSIAKPHSSSVLFFMYSINSGCVFYIDLKTLLNCKVSTITLLPFPLHYCRVFIRPRRSENSPAKFRSFPKRALLFHINSPATLHCSPAILNENPAFGVVKPCYKSNDDDGHYSPLLFINDRQSIWWDI